MTVRLRCTSHRYAYALLLLIATAAVGCRDSTAPQSPVFPTDPADAQFISDDVDRYWRAYAAGGRLGQSDVFQRIYLDSASTALREFMGLRSVTASALATQVSGAPRYFAALEAWWRSSPPTAPVFEVIRRNFGRLKAHYPEAFFPPVNFLIGRYSSGGTIGASGVFVSLEFFGADAQAPVDELSAFGRANQLSWTVDLPRLVAHEHAHLLQRAVGGLNGASSGNLLRRAMGEGVAEFVGSLGSGGALFQSRFALWEAREREFWLAFDRERSGTDVSRWLYNQGQTTGDWPGDLGYFMGFRIAQAYYDRATDKHQAIEDLLALRDPERLLLLSGYAGSGPPLTIAR